MFTKLQVLATVLDIRIEQHEGRPHWVKRNGPIVRVLGHVINEHPKPGENIRAMTMQQAVWKVMEQDNLDEACQWTVLSQSSPRAGIYMELEADRMRQELADGEKMDEVIADKDPRDAISIIMEHIKLGLAMQLANPHEVIKGFFRLAVLAIAAYQWSQRWVATLQTKPLAEPIKNLFAFPVPPKNIPVPPPLVPVPPLAEGETAKEQADKLVPPPPETQVGPNDPPPALAEEEHYVSKDEHPCPICNEHPCVCSIHQQEGDE